MMMSPEPPFADEDDHIRKQLIFMDSEETDVNGNGSVPLALYTSSPVKRAESSRNETNSSLSSGSDEDRLNSSTESVGEVNLKMRRPVLRQIRSNDDTTPPYRKVRALRLFTSPRSPKTLLDHSEQSTAESNRIKPRLFETDNKKHNFLPTRREGTTDKKRNMLSTSRDHIPFRSPQLEANINPFYNSDAFPTSGKRRRDDSGLNETSLSESSEKSDNELENKIQHPKKRIHLRKSSAPLTRYEMDFDEVGLIGSGMFGSVYKCVHRLDRCTYAIKKLKKPLRGTSDERAALIEVYAHSILDRHKHVVRYYCAWAQDGQMIIQNEFCDGGSLAEAIEEKIKKNELFSEAEVKKILRHTARGLRHIHSNKLAHLDIKPGNIFISINRNKPLPVSPASSPDNGFGDEDFDSEDDDELIYKIGDLGHVTSFAPVPEAIEEGDCRYMPAELLQDNYEHLPKADIFALGVTAYEVCSKRPLPKNGVEWHAIRQGRLPYLQCYSKDLNILLQQMTHPDPEQRPTSSALIHNPTLVPYGSSTKEQLHKALTCEKYKNRLLSMQLKAAASELNQLNNESSKRRLSRLVGGKVNRSSSVTNF